MSDEYGTTNLKKDELSFTSVVSDIQVDIISESDKKQKTPSMGDHEETSCSSVLESSDPLAAKPESHSVGFKTSAVAKRYKITLAQARRMALNVAKKANRRCARALENEPDIEGLGGN